MKVHLVDGTYELFRAFYSPGKPSGEWGATKGFLRSMISMLRRDDVTHVGVAFDTVIESFRNELFDGYKTGEGIDPELKAQFPMVERAAEALGMVVWRMIEFEADDAIAAAAVKFIEAPEVEQSVICTPDKDLSQVARGKEIILWDRRRDRFMDEAHLTEKFGVPPASIPDYLALVGDPQDGIPGIPRWGAKSAAQILTAYGTLETIPEDPSDWSVPIRGKAKLSENLRAEWPEALLYRRLATLRLDAPIPESLDAMRWAGPADDKLAALATDIEDRSIFDRVEALR
ncbi:MAG: 5'-3' exonuclease H3TH domain-containing protein [Myxococcota bacterium]